MINLKLRINETKLSIDWKLRQLVKRSATNHQDPKFTRELDTLRLELLKSLEVIAANIKEN